MLPEELRVSHLAKEFYPLGMKQTPTRKRRRVGHPSFLNVPVYCDSVILNFYGRHQEEGAKVIVGHPPKSEPGPPAEKTFRIAKEGFFTASFYAWGF